MHDDPRYRVEVEVLPRFLAQQSVPDEGRYTFAYYVRIHNAGTLPARLIARHWTITDADGRTEQVDGKGVVGDQPWLRPGETYDYTSSMVLGTEHGQMQGHYDMVADDGTEFIAPIAAFVLSVPRTLH